MPKVEPVRIRNRERKNITSGIAYIESTFNNTRITITDVHGNTIAWSSPKVVGFSGSRKNSPFAAQVATEDCSKKAQAHGMSLLEVKVTGLGAGRDSAMRALRAIGFVIVSIRDITMIAHNGCRPRKRRRI
ncbi:30S ribosomal protein S11 [Candidatus Liberibacter americanus]|uniref:Small ribosomal subunit protein uS11 n=1 Tax=Candidatus Liberibacter americanus str. Sao Paulo TaxID=1261131 RepID=U6B957_9HYPH|nr:30S ribosomal protein S11 [Candidatus Liberibacter americanus]AHA28252.1 Ribosomal protein S11 [Candidatus Liberibacter americanus str. Sao Paulo]EMS36234.1 30S ribosomal protein S11 [Candidatus Liberibacter americanus PW_SP]